ncbi:ribonuclease E [Defluviimonas denitrificans]|jgi:ribonuclease E|uniref:Ribonuclease E n=1 Tax=Albidovulum denitrificans TaxID=404881 RepID=A0A2S8SC67_9RHOB|nr:ribonuclease E/G [Defluviimonas denitrificans]PQV58431.1 ribonuclease E [Defluviimonas denitrificans]
MAKKMLIDATHAEETRVVVVDGNKVEEFDFETANKRQLAGNIYLAKITRVEPSLQAAFVDYGGNRHGFLAFSEIHPDYYQIPVADREALLAEERAYAEAQEAEEPRRRRSRRAPKAEKAETGDKVVSSDDIPGMSVVDLSDEDAPQDAEEAKAVPEVKANETPEVEADSDHREADSDHHDDDGDEPYVAADHASDTDEDIESVADEDVTEEIRQPRKPRPRKYKIQEVVKVRQIMLVQVVKEERGNKGAALTTYLSLAGRYCVLMPNTARGGGISRKITNAADRKKLKEIAGEIEVPQGAGLIIRTAGSQRTKAEIKRDYEYLMRLWEQIRDLTMKSIAPAPIYEEGDLIKRSIRDLYNKDIDEVLVEGAEGYRAAKDFMKMIMPSHAKNVKNYAEGLPLFARYQVESYLAGMFNPTVQLKSGGYIVIGVTEALVAIDVNSGRATKEGSIEDTALKTNLEAAEEVARQLRLRDLAGLIVIDFIDMEERKNNAAVEKRLKDKLKTDRARIQVGRISGFGLLEMSRQRLRPGMLESTTQPCAHCHGTGIIRSDDSLALQILRQLEEEGTRKRSREVLLKAPVAVVNFLVNNKREHIAQIELRYGMAVRLEAEPALISPDFEIEKFKTATRNVPEAPSQVVSVDALRMQDAEEDEDIVEADEDEEAEEAAPAPASEDGDAPRKKKRRRRRRRKSGNGGTDAAREDGHDEGEAEAGAEAATDEAPAETGADADAAGSEPAEPKKRRVSRSSRSRKSKVEETPAEEVAATEAPAEAAEATEAPAEAEAAPKPKARRSRAKAKPAEEAPAEAAEAPAEEAPAKPKTTRSRTRKPKAAPVAAAEPVAEAAPAPAAAEPAPEPVEVAASAPVPMPEPAPHAANSAPQADPAEAEAPEAEDSAAKPRRRGWWSLGR